ncbi:MAG: NAD(P)-dependent oxidoreductase [Gammaproteobacteria bacterium]|nr:NAD(P)-dependent oxidoreductase [Gammaproteobacteria bacterium]
MKIGFIGASGMMGHGMAKCLVRHQHEVSVSVRNHPQKVADLLALGAKVTTIDAMANEVECLFLCVTGTPEVENLMEAEHGILHSGRAGLVVIDCSTSEPSSTKRLQLLAERKAMHFIDAPLARTPVEAELGKLNIMVGAPESLFHRLLPIFQCMAENVFWVGEVGTAHTFKLLNNFIGQAIATATAEAFAVGSKAGVDLRQLVSIISAGAVNSGIFQMMAKSLDGHLDGLKFELDNARKDIRYYTHLAEELGVPSLVGESVHQTLNLASALGYGKKFVPSLVEAQEKIAQVSIVPK